MRNNPAVRVFIYALALLIGCSSGGKTDPLLKVATDSFPDAFLGVAYSATALARNGSPPYSWAVPAGSLPAGLSITASTGEISGTPTALGASSFTLRVTDAGSSFAEKPLQVTVSPQPIRILTKRLPYAVRNQPYVFTIAVEGATGALTWNMVGSPPPNIWLDTSTGTLTGMVTAAAAPSSFGILAAEAPLSDFQMLAIEVDPDPLTVIKVRQSGGTGYYTSIALALAAATTGPLTQATVIEIDDDSTYAENLNVSFNTATGSEWLAIRPAYDKSPLLQPVNPAGSPIRIQSPNVELRGLRISGATGAPGIRVDDAVSNVFVVNCVISGCDTGIETGLASAVTLTHNTVHCRKGISASGLATCLVHGNIVYATGEWAFRSTGCAADYNLLYAPSGDIGTDGTNTYSTLAAWSAATGSELNGKSADPLFVSAALGDYRLQPGSPAVDSGFKNSYTPFTDADMHSRDNGANYDMGAYERKQ